MDKAGPQGTGERVVGAWLERHLGEPWLRVVDVRRDGDEGRPQFVDVGGRAWIRTGHACMPSSYPPASYVRGHVPGAVHLDVAWRLFDGDGALVCAPELAMAMSEIGVGDDHMVVMVDDGTAPVALVARWALARYGHEAVHVLEGGLKRWTAEGRPVAHDVVRLPPASFTARVRSVRRSA
jgi:thiosulfate/3-mercaptopyruvate sulfurtransferase